ncbi:MAG: hypothetical protein ACYC2G_09340 [Gemmatimonadaceae bacterium]
MHSQEISTHHGIPPSDEQAEYRHQPPGAHDQCTGELVRQLRGYVPQSTAFAIAVRRFVRARRAAGRELESVVGELRTVLRDQVAPLLAPEHRTRMTTAVLWFAVSEFHRAD